MGCVEAATLDIRHGRHVRSRGDLARAVAQVTLESGRGASGSAELGRVPHEIRLLIGNRNWPIKSASKAAAQYPESSGKTNTLICVSG